MTLKDAAVANFKKSLRGVLLSPADGPYEQVRKVWNGMIDKRPALIARCSGVADVVRAINFARNNDLLVSVRGGGHNIAGKAVCDGGLMIDLSKMTGVRVDTGNRTALAEGGATLKDLNQATQAFGLAVPAGVVDTTGVAGLTLGGGGGWLARKYGLSCDNLLSVEVVTADGQVLQANSEENPDLFWGLRGGSGNFGIVTSFNYQLHTVGPEILGGSLFHPLDKAREALKFYHEYSSTAPDELAANAGLVTSPEGDRLMHISVCYAGNLEEGKRVLEPLRRFGQPLSDQIGRITYLDLQSRGGRRFGETLHYYWKTHFLKQISEEAIDLLVTNFSTVPSPFSSVGFQQYGGAISRVGPLETAYSHRDAQYDFVPSAVWSDPNDSEMNIEWSREVWESMKPFSTGGEYVNNLGQEGEDRVRAAYGDNYDRLLALKNKYDPTNFFRLNANIKPTV